MKPSCRIGGLLLAGGSSRRMGRAKQLLPLGRETLLSLAIKNALASQLDPVIVVLGHKAQEIKTHITPLLSDPRIFVVVNPLYGKGMSESIKVGLKAMASHQVQGVMILLADQPRVGPEVLDRLIGAFSRSQKPICQPIYGGIKGNPVLFDRSLLPSLTTIAGDRGGRTLLKEHPEWVCYVEFANSGMGVDLDTPEAYEKFQKEYD